MKLSEIFTRLNRKPVPASVPVDQALGKEFAAHKHARKHWQACLHDDAQKARKWLEQDAEKQKKIINSFDPADINIVARKYGDFLVWPGYVDILARAITDITCTRGKVCPTIIREIHGVIYDGPSLPNQKGRTVIKISLSTGGHEKIAIPIEIGEIALERILDLFHSP